VPGHAAAIPAVEWACAGSTRLVLHTEQALTFSQAQAFCSSQHGITARLPLPAGEEGAVAQALVTNAKVGPHLVVPGRCARPAACDAALLSEPCGACFQAAPRTVHRYLTAHATSVAVTKQPSDAQPRSPLQLSSVPDTSHPWTAAAWMGITRSPAAPDAWVDYFTSGPVAITLPWCPGEPNDLSGDEKCAALLTACTGSSGGAAAALNDYSCAKPLRVICAFPSDTCGEAPADKS
jgi:hypothetical protein